MTAAQEKNHVPSRMAAFVGTCLFAFVVFVAGNMFTVTQAWAEDVSSTYVTSITADRTTANDWGKVTYTMNYSAEDKDDIKSGDVISVTWPTSGDAYFDVESDTTLDIVLTNKTVTDPNDPHDANNHPIVGKVNITDSGVTATFDQYVEKYYNVTGTVTFTVRARNTTTTNQDVTVTSGDQTSTVTVKPNNGSGVIGFAGKYASWVANDEETNQDYDHVYWTVRVNQNFASNNTGTVTIVDDLNNIQGGGVSQTFDSLTAVNVYYLDENGDSHWGTGESGDSAVRDWITNTMGGTVSTTGNVVRITIPASSLNSYPGSATNVHGKPVCVFFQFRTNLSSHNVNEWALNDALVTHQDTTMTEPKADTAHTSIQVPNNSSTATGVTPGTLQITKTVGDSHTALSGVSFKVYKLDDDGNTVSGWYNGADYATITTGDGGVGKITGLRDGKYRVVEDDGPSWVVIDKDTEHDVTLTTTAGANLDVNDQVKTTSVTANKAWTGDATGDTHPTIYFQLYRYTGSDASTATAVENSIKSLPNGTTSVTWKNMPVADDNGNTYHYVFKEVDADGNVTVPTGYTSDQPANGAADGKTITNTRKTTKVQITKTWSDADNQDGIRPSADEFASMVHLYKTVNGQTSEVEGATATVTADGDNAYTVKYTGLPETEANGDAITYTVKEDVPDGYASDQGDNGVENGGTLTNTHVPGTTSIVITKKWDDADNQDGIRPSADDFAGMVHLYQTVGDQTSELTTATPEITDNGDGTYTVSYANLPQKENGADIAYTITEDLVSGYASDQPEGGVEDGGTVTNTHEVDKVSVTITKKWKDGNDKDKLRPSADEFASWVTLVGNGEDIDVTPEVTDNGDGTYTVTYSDLPKNANGEEIAYTVREDLPDGSGYKASDDEVANGGTITNRHTPKDVQPANDKPKPSKKDADSNSDTTSVTKVTDTDTMPQTGDSADLALGFGVAALAGAGALVAARRRREN
ncbi:MAG: Cna B-type domain-containing protein [Eggerthellaceae bacterium]|jgi:LPXTG-motif cell wall-anchored protein